MTCVSLVKVERAKLHQPPRRRQAPVLRLEKLILQNKAVRKHKFLQFSVKGKPALDYQAVERAGLFDGLKGYLTNNESLTNDEVISHYN